MKAIHRTIAENLRENYLQRLGEFNAIPRSEKLDRAFVNGCVSESMHVIDTIADALSRIDASFDREFFRAIAYDNTELVAKLTRENRNR
jgi:hypothetical protein